MKHQSSHKPILRTHSRAALFSLFFFLGTIAVFTAQVSYTFTPCGATGQSGPTQLMANATYTNTNLSGSVTVSSGIQSFTIPSSGSYKLEAYGAAGGKQLYSVGYPGGLGAYISGVFTFTAGQVVKFLVGQKGNDTQGTPADNAAPGGGGGSFAFYNVTDPLPLIAAGGGGGGGSASSGSIDASITTTANPSMTGAAGGTAGNGGGVNTGGNSYWAGGGAGWLTDGTGGANSTSYSYLAGGSSAAGGRTPANGGTGGLRWNDGTDEGGDGGFGGGGGGGSDNMGTGGGGGFSGGGGANSGSFYANYTGGGGASYNGGTSAVNTASANSGHGRIILTRLSGVTITKTASITCYGLSNAALTASASGGTAPYTYTWSTGVIGTSITGLGVATYTVYATDAASNTYSSTYVLTQPAPVTALTSTQTNLTCYGASNGVLGITAGGGTPPYTYNWSPSGGTSAVASGLSAGSYTCIVADVNNCITAQVASITQPASTLNVIGFATSTAVCSGQSSILLGGGALTYTWTGGAINGVSFAPAATSNYTVTGTDVNGCTASATVAIVVNPLPPVSITGPSVICTSNSATLTVSGANTYTWSTAATSTTIGISPSSTTTYSVSGTSASGCINSSSKMVTVINTSPLITANASSTAACIGSSITLFGSGGSSYSWSGGISDNVPFAPTLSATYSLTGFNACGSATSSIFIPVNTLPTITASSSSSAVCLGTSATLNGGGGISYSWSNGVTNNSAFLPSVTTTYTVTGTDANNCQNTATKQIIVHSLPPVVANATNSLVCLGNTTTLFGSGALSYSWSGGITNNTPFSPASSSNYVVTGTDANGCQNTATASITVINAPALTVSASNPAVCQGNSTSLSASGALSYTWTGGVTNNVAFSPSSTDTYTVYGTNSCGTTSNMITVTVNPLPNVTANASNTVTCYGKPIALFGGGASTYTWSGGITNNVNFSPTSSASYTVNGTDLNGCQNSAVKVLTVVALPVVTASASSSAFCLGNSTTLNGGGASTYAWSGGVTNNVAFSPNFTSVYTVTGTAASGCQNTTAITITVYQLPFVYGYSSNSSVCFSNQTTLYGSGANSYTWSGGVTNGTSFTPTVTTTYTVNGTNATTGCTSTNNAVVTIVVNPLPSLTITPSSASVCAGQTLSLLASGANSYIWSNNVANGTAFLPSGSSTYTVTGYNSTTGCQNVAYYAVTINALPTVTATVSNNNVCAGTTIVFNGTGANTYTWNAGIINGAPFVALNSGNYFVSGTNTLTGCTSTNVSSQYVNVNSSPLLVISISNPTVCSGIPVTITTSGANTYSWTGGITDGVAFIPSVTTVYTVVGTSTVTGCSATQTKTLIVNPTPQLAIVSTVTAACIGTPITLLASGADTYTWTGGVVNGVAFFPSASATYSVKGKSSTTGCVTSNTLAINIPLYAPPVVSSSVDLPGVCLGSTVIFTSTGADIYTWTNGPTEGLPFAPSQTDTYAVTGTSTLTGCTSTNISTQMVFVYPLPALTVAASSSLICSGESNILTVGSTSSYTWSTGQTSSTISVSPSVTTVYSATVKNSNNCLNTASITVDVSDCTGLSAFSKTSALLVYPNPNNGSFVIKADAEITLQIINDIGQVVKTLNLEERNSREISVQDLPAGIYFLVGQANTKEIKQKIIVTK
ncbi:hypothetical protein CNR22_15465 [Sphingobacteriaceae bacterium]|nr:hypothetical protein CNR22_15465 [Sphingobacteriaceae bacterium]